jgi:hypothetical protein
MAVERRDDRRFSERLLVEPAMPTRSKTAQIRFVIPPEPPPAWWRLAKVFVAYKRLPAFRAALVAPHAKYVVTQRVAQRKKSVDIVHIRE